MAAAVVDGNNLGSVLPPGSELSCTTTQGDTLRGNVVATDDQTKVVVITEDDGSLGTNVHVINLEHVSDLELLSQSPQLNPTPPLPEINLQRVRRRMEQNIEAKWKEVNSRGVGVSKEAQLLFDSIRKMYDDIRWDDSTIVVLNDVRISPPYTSENCAGSSSSAVGRIQKLVSKFHEETKSEN